MIANVVVALAAVVSTAAGVTAALPSSAAAVGQGAGGHHGSAAWLPARDEQVSFVVEGTTTYGTLHVPARRRGERLAAALLLPGSGPTDRDGNQPPALTPNTLRDLAGVLDRDRVVTLRFDKYATGLTGLGAWAGRVQEIDYPAFVRQAEAAGDYLRRRAEVAWSRVAVVGHSEGAMTALVLAANAPFYRRAAALVMLQPQAMRFLDVLAMQLHDQVKQLVAAGGLSEKEGDTVDRAIDVAVADLRGGRPVDTSAMPTPFATFFQSLAGPNRRFVTSDDAVNPPDVARRLPPMPVLLTCGTLDTQVPCHTADQLTSVVGQRHRVVLPGVGHTMKTADGTLSPELIRQLSLLRW
ncbi:pimeloyl-ACP methyl ester carboxylesterase [Kibdelosporangium banguiense]|uniref:Pimeloyl-ACP methyl ester carboxylesterase n=1 Tax=Kibdelosporangium banguiense TaxID=1365924 RepID=A0ABS4T8Y4_9PSEU|nr:alpha/beta hydrolase [Kibdelosporangium banguiense]MBP2320394.1 pimeloyl-ACP methyl ester carboxylesterase [Kibdelosporangium banguiense]